MAPEAESSPAPRLEVAVVCVGTSHPGNVGAIARGAANFGVTDLRFVAPRCDVKSIEAIARAKHSKESLENALVTDTLEEALVGTSLSVGTTARQTLRENRFLRKTLDVREWAESIGELEGKIALVFGREDSGLNAEEVNMLDQLVTVPTADYSSLNLAHAVTLLCYETFRIAKENITPERHLDPDTLRSMHEAWDDLVVCVETREWRQDVAKGIFRKIVGRSLPDDHEVHNIMGILGNALKRFDHPDWRTASSSKGLAAKGLIASRAGEEE